MTTPSRVLVTGANGFAGRALIKRLTARPDVSVLAVGGAHGHDLDTRLDVCDADAVDELVARVRPNVLVHLAAQAAVAKANLDPRRTWAVNVGGTVNLLAAVRSWAPDCRFVYVSSAEVYGRAFETGVSVKEDAALEPLSVYGASKAAAETAVLQNGRDGLATVIFRPFNHTGPGQSLDFVLPSFAAQIAAIEAGRSEPVLRVGDLTHARDFLDVEDVVSAYEAAVVNRGFEGRVLNIASGVARPIRDLLDMLLALSPMTVTVEVDPSRLRSGGVRAASGDHAALQALIDWRPSVGIADTLRRLLDAARRAEGVVAPS